MRAEYTLPFGYLSRTATLAGRLVSVGIVAPCPLAVSFRKIEFRSRRNLQPTDASLHRPFTLVTRVSGAAGSGRVGSPCHWWGARMVGFAVECNYPAGPSPRSGRQRGR